MKHIPNCVHCGQQLGANANAQEVHESFWRHKNPRDCIDFFRQRLNMLENFEEEDDCWGSRMTERVDGIENRLSILETMFGAHHVHPPAPPAPVDPRDRGSE